MYKLVLAFNLLLLTCTAAASAHLGQQGTVWPIIEPDFRDVVSEQLNNNPKYTKELASLSKQGRNYLDQTEGVYLPVTLEDSVTSFTPVFTLKEDKRYLKKRADGSYQWETLYPRGTKVYPLRMQRVTEWLFIFDASKHDEIILAKAIAQGMSKKNARVKLIATQGSLSNAIKITGTMVYRLPVRFLNAIPVQSVPTLVGQQTAAKDYLTIVTHKAPFDQAFFLENVK